MRVHQFNESIHGKRANGSDRFSMSQRDGLSLKTWIQSNTSDEVPLLTLAMIFRGLDIPCVAQAPRHQRTQLLRGDAFLFLTAELRLAGASCSLLRPQTSSLSQASNLRRAASPCHVRDE